MKKFLIFSALIMLLGCFLGTNAMAVIAVCNGEDSNKFPCDLDELQDFLDNKCGTGDPAEPLDPSVFYGYEQILDSFVFEGEWLVTAIALEAGNELVFAEVEDPVLFMSEEDDSECYYSDWGELKLVDFDTSDYQFVDLTRELYVPFPVEYNFCEKPESSCRFQIYKLNQSTSNLWWLPNHPDLELLAGDIIIGFDDNTGNRDFDFVDMVLVMRKVDPDSDGDGVPDSRDNCPDVSNPDQLNTDNDVFGDACDNCRLVPNDVPTNSDGDEWGDACDNCVNDYQENQLDSDEDGLGDVCDNATHQATVDQCCVTFDDTQGDFWTIDLHLFVELVECKDASGNDIIPIHSDSEINIDRDAVLIKPGAEVCVDIPMDSFNPSDLETAGSITCKCKLQNPISGTTQGGETLKVFEVISNPITLDQQTIMGSVDIKPGSDTNSINCSSNGETVVAFVSTDAFDACGLDPATARWGSAMVVKKGNGDYKASCKDVSGNSLPDLVVNFYTQELDIQSDHKAALVTGVTKDGQIRFAGQDSIVPIKCPTPPSQ